MIKKSLHFIPHVTGKRGQTRTALSTEPGLQAFAGGQRCSQCVRIAQIATGTGFLPAKTQDHLQPPG